MHDRRLSKNCLLLFVALAASAVGHAQPNIAFDSTPAPGKTISVTGDKDASLAVYSAADASNCNLAGFPNLGSPVQISTGGSDPAASVTLTGMSQSITLGTPTKAGDTLCLSAVSGGVPKFLPGTVVNPVVIKIDFAEKPVAGSNAIKVKGDDQAVVFVYQFPAAYTPASKSPNCSFADFQSGKGQVLPIGSTAPTTNSITVNGSAPFPITLNKPVQAGTQLCLYATEKDAAGNVTPYYSPLTAAQDAPAVAQTPPPTPPDFTGTPASGDTSIVITGVNKATVSVYQFDETLDTSNESTCKNKVGVYAGKLLSIAGSGTNAASTLSTNLTDPAPYTISLVNPLLPGKQLCIEETGAANAAGVTPDPVFSKFVTVSDSNNPYPRVRTFYTAGAMINNQNGSNSAGNSSTGAEYLDLGMNFALKREAPGWHPGFNTAISGRFSAVSVTAPSSTTTTPSNSGTLNILSSQESFRVLGAVSFPIREGGTDAGFHFFSAPLIKAGFDTLLNPSATASAGSAGTATLTAATFAPVYWEYSSGVRMGYRHYPATGDTTPRTLTQVDLTIGKFSNLQSFLCNTSVTTGTSTTQPTNTSCYSPQTTGASSYTLYRQSRSTQYRMEVEGFFLFPGTPFVLGIDANLPQSALAPRSLDILNKAGGNVAVYFGVSGNLTNLFKNLKLAGSPQ